MALRATRPAITCVWPKVPRKRAPLAGPRRIDAAPGRPARPGCCWRESAHTGPVAKTNKFPLSAILLLGIGLILAIFSVCYTRARSSERGTSRDDTPAAEVGAAPRDR